MKILIILLYLGFLCSIRTLSSNFLIYAYMQTVFVDIAGEHEIHWCIIFRPADDKTYNKTCVTSKDSDQPVHPPSMARVLVYPSFNSPDAVKGTCDQRRLWSDSADAQSDLSLRWSHKSYCRFCRALAQFLYPIDIRTPDRTCSYKSVWPAVDVSEITGWDAQCIPWSDVKLFGKHCLLKAVSPST